MIKVSLGNSLNNYSVSFVGESYNKEYHEIKHLKGTTIALLKKSEDEPNE